MPWGGGGGAASLINLVDREFADRTARDTFYNLNQENRNTLSQGESVILVLDNGSSDAVIEIWVGPDAPTTYDNTDWADITSAIPSASVVKTLYESNPNTNPLVDLASQILALLSMDNEGNVNTSASWVFPDGTVYVSENLGIEGAGEAFAVFDRANDRRGYLVGYERGINTRPFYRNLTEENIDVTIQGLTDTNSGTQTFTQNLTLTANRLVTKIYLESTETVTGANLRLLRGSRVVALALEQDFTANTIKEIEIPQGIFCPTGSELTVDIDGVTLKGTGTGQDFEIFLKIDEWRFVQVNLANVDDLPSGPSGGHPLLTIRDTPPIATLTAIAEASVNDNTGLYVVAADQIQATEDTVDTSIMIRALRSGLIDANGDAISTTSRQKRGLRLAGGTLVRVFSGTDLRIVSTPSMTEAGARYPDISAVSPPLQLVGSQILYNTYRNRTFVLTDSSSVVADVFEVRLPSLQNALDLGWVNRNDVFGYRNDRTDSATFNIRTFQVGTEFSSGGSAITVSPGNSLYINPAPSGAVWQVLIFGQSTEVP